MAEEENFDFDIFPGELYVAGSFVALSCLLALYQNYVHVTHYRAPALQRPIIRILLMVPIYGLCSFFSLLYKDLAIFIDVARDTYEAFILYQFMALLVEYCGGERELVRVLNCKQARAKHLVPFCCLGFTVDKDFLLLCKRGTLQYCIVKPLTAIIAMVCYIFGVYHDGDLDFAAPDAYPTLFVINNLCVGVSMYYLVLFGTALEDELKIHKPMMKFMCIKCIIFFSFWQGAVFTVLVKLGWLIHNRYDYTEEELAHMSPSPQLTPTVTADQVQAALQDFCICVEMFCISIMHHWAFSYTVLQREISQSRYAYLFLQGPASKTKQARQQLDAMAHMGDAVNLVDVIQDGKRTFGRVKSGLLEDDINYQRVFGMADRKVDPRTRLPIVELDPAQVVHFPFFFRDDRTMFYWFGPVKRTTSKGKQIGCMLAISDTALYLLTPHGEPKRFVPIDKIDEVISDSDTGTVSFRIPSQYDMQLHPVNAAAVTEIVHILTQWFRIFGDGRELKTNFFGGAELNLETPRDAEVVVPEPPCRMDPRTDLPIAVVPSHLRPMFSALCSEGSTLYFFDTVLRVKPHMQASRILAITDAAVLIMKPEGEVRRCIALGDVEQVYIDHALAQVAFIVPREYDLLVQCSGPEQAQGIVTIAQAWFRYFVRGAGAQLRLTYVSKQNQRKLMLRNPEMNKHQAPWFMGHRKGKDKSAKYGPKSLDFGVTLDELARNAPAGDFHWAAQARGRNRSFAGDTSSNCSGGEEDDATAKDTVTVDMEDGPAKKEDKRQLRHSDSDTSSDEESSGVDVLVQVGMQGLAAVPPLNLRALAQPTPGPGR
eukprot:EG_transcript_3183